MALENTIPCITDEIVGKYADLANQFTQDLSAALLTPMWLMFVALTGLWIVIQGLRLAVDMSKLPDVLKEFLFVMIAALLLSGQGPDLVNLIYKASLDMMGSAASVALQVGQQGNTAAPTGADGTVPLGAGMKALVCTAEDGVMKVFGIADEISHTATLTDPLPLIYALVLLVPYFIVLVVYFSQVVISIFRVMMLATLSPYLMLGFGFGWGRDMAKSGIKTLLAAFMVLFGSTAALAVMLYAVSSLDLGSAPSEEALRDMIGVTKPEYLLAVAMGWLGTAFMLEATGIANSISGSVLSNSAAAAITAGAATSALLLKNNPLSKAAGSTMASGASELASKAPGVAGNVGGALLHPGNAIDRGAQAAMDRITKTRGY